MSSAGTERLFVNGTPGLQEKQVATWPQVSHFPLVMFRWIADLHFDFSWQAWQTNIRPFRSGRKH